MTTHINGIVQTTRRIAAIEAEMITKTGPGRRAMEARHNTETKTRFDQVLAAIKNGVDPDLIQWAIGNNDSAAKIQMQYAVAQIAAALVQDEELLAA
jgi:hypothetical protein